MAVMSMFYEKNQIFQLLDFSEIIYHRSHRNIYYKCVKWYELSESHIKGPQYYRTKEELALNHYRKSSHWLLCKKGWIKQLVLSSDKSILKYLLKDPKRVDYYRNKATEDFQRFCKELKEWCIIEYKYHKHYIEICDKVFVSLKEKIPNDIIEIIKKFLNSNYENDYENDYKDRRIPKELLEHIASFLT